MVDEPEKSDLSEKDGDLESDGGSPSDLESIHIQITSSDPALSVSEQMEQLHNSIKGVAASVYESMLSPTDVADIFKSLTTQLQEVVRPATENLWAQFAGITHSIEKIWETFDLDDERAKKIIPYFKQAGLWLSPSMPLSVWYECERAYLDGKLTSSLVQSIYLDIFSADDYQLLREIISNWYTLPEFRYRKRFIEDAFEAHINGKYTLSVPTLLVVIEGILKAIFGMPKGGLGKFKEKIRAQILDTPFFHQNDQVFSDLYDDLHEDKRKENRLNRNKILHGEDWTYDIELHSLQAFLFLDSFAEINREILTPKPKDNSC